MKTEVFLSWSGEKSRAAAEAFHKWLPTVLQNVQPWMSARNITAGGRWGLEIGRALERTQFGILFVTSTNISHPWLLFEAGALAKALDGAFVCPYLLGIEPEDLPEGPISQFQYKRSDKKDTLDLLISVNSAQGDQALEREVLLKIFDRAWVEIEEEMQKLSPEAPPKTRSSDEILSEILQLVRGLASETIPLRVNLGPPDIESALEVARAALGKRSESAVSQELQRRLRFESLVRMAEVGALSAQVAESLLGESHLGEVEKAELREAFERGRRSRL